MGEMIRTILRGRRFVLCCFVAIAGALEAEAQWVRSGVTTNAPIWGFARGLQFALHPAGFTGGDGGPRGLIRLGYPTLINGTYDLINFIAVEPTVNGVKGYSELEKSLLDGKPGKLFWAGRWDPTSVSEVAFDPGEIVNAETSDEELHLTVHLERFENGAHVRLTLVQRKFAPNELKLTVEAETDSAPIESCVLTSTMGNKARTRLLFLKDGPISSLQLYPDYRAEQFAPHRFFALERLPRSANGDVLVSIKNDEENPQRVQPFGKSGFWDYRGEKVVQYWRKVASEVKPDLKCVVNARFMYWMSKQPIPGGIAFENFELREPFRSGQSFIFGIARAGEDIMR